MIQTKTTTGIRRATPETVPFPSVPLNRRKITMDETKNIPVNQELALLQNLLP